MTVRVFFKGESSDKDSMDYLDIKNVDSWSVSPNLLTVFGKTGEVFNYPLTNIKVFTEVVDEE